MKCRIRQCKGEAYYIYFFPLYNIEIIIEIAFKNKSYRFYNLYVRCTVDCIKFEVIVKIICRIATR